MLKKIIILLGISLLFFKQVSAQEVKNNKFGIHLAQPHLEDLIKAKELVNSQGGDWGYVTLVIQEDDRNKEKWQEIFDKLRQLHLIPLIRLATRPEGAKWRKPAAEDADSWASFLDSLNWVVKERYIILFNEPNHASEWGGVVYATGYAKVALELAKKLKEKNPDFFVMLAGLDASAPQALPNFQDEMSFFKEFFNNITVEQFNNLFSGLASHSYPNPAFSGSPEGFGRGSVRTYQWELQVLKNLGVNEDLPVFITETGWVRNSLNEGEVAANFALAFESVWQPDDRISAVTPFVLDYQGEPFLNFSFKKFQENEFYQQYYTLRDLAKVRGEPEQIEKGEISSDLPSELVTHSSFHLTVKLKNTGQALWDKEFGYKLSLDSDQNKSFEYFFSDIKKVKPFEEEEADLFIKTNGNLGKRVLKIQLLKNDARILESDNWNFTIFPLPKLNFQVWLFPHLRTNGVNFEVQVFSDREELVFRKKNVKVESGKGTVEEVQNIALGKKYRIVILKSGYLPRQVFTVFRKGENKITFEFMIPLDFNKDGKLDLDDASILFKNPALLLKSLF